MRPCVSETITSLQGLSRLTLDTLYGGCNIPPYHPSFSQAMQTRLDVKSTSETQHCFLGTNQTLGELLKSLLEAELNIISVDRAPSALKDLQGKLSKCRLLLMEGDTQGMNLLAPSNTIVAEIGDSSRDHSYHGWLQRYCPLTAVECLASPTGAFGQLMSPPRHFLALSTPPSSKYSHPFSPVGFASADCPCVGAE